MPAQTTEKTRKEMLASAKQELAGAETTRSGRAFAPPVDILETAGALTILADMPGVLPGGLTIDLRDNVLTIDGVVADASRENERPLITEYEIGSFYRQFRLSREINQSAIDARLEDGVLRLTLPKAEAAMPRKIEVHGI